VPIETKAIDQQKMDQFVHRVLGDTSALTTAVLGALGDKLGLFKDLHVQGPASSAELARRAGVQERYAREWLRAMASAGYLTYDLASHRFALPPEHAPVLAQETGPVFFGGTWEMLMGMLRPIDKLAQAFKEGGGVTQTDYPDATYHGMDRFTAGWFENLLVQEWLPAVPAVKAALYRGIDVADVGCGRGRALIQIGPGLPQGSGRRLRHLSAEHRPGNCECPGRRPCCPCQVRAPRRVQSDSRPVRSDHDVRRDSRCGRPSGASAHDSPGAATARDLPLPGRQLVGQAGGEHGAAGLALLRIQHGVLHDHLAGQRWRRSGHVWATRVQAPRARPVGGVPQRAQAAAGKPVQQPLRGQAVGATLRASERGGPSPRGSRKETVPADELAVRKHERDEAARSTPHGRPIELRGR